MAKLMLLITLIGVNLFTIELLANCQNCNVVLIAIDALQAKRISSLGYSRQTTPTLDKIASEGVSFSQAISPSSWTIPTYLSVFSSTFPTEHGLTNRYRTFNKDNKVPANFAKDKPNLQVMADLFKKKGYRTGAFTGASGLSAELGYDKGFEVFKETGPFGGIESSTNKALDWINGLKKNDRFFLLVHGYDSHGQFTLPQDYKGKFLLPSKKFKGTKQEEESLREAKVQGKSINIDYNDKEFWSAWYDSKIFDADQRLKAFLENFEKLPQSKNTIFVIFSDHGTEIFEHDAMDHGHTLYDELIRVPLIFKGPGIKQNFLVSEQVGLIDILPTVVDFLSLKISKKFKAQMKGRSLKQTLLGKQIDPADVFSETDYRGIVHKRSIRTKDGWKLIITLDDGSDELYDLKNDPQEKINLSAVHKDKTKQLMSNLDKHLTSMNAK